MLWHVSAFATRGYVCADVADSAAVADCRPLNLTVRGFAFGVVVVYFRAVSWG